MAGGDKFIVMTSRRWLLVRAIHLRFQPTRHLWETSFVVTHGVEKEMLDVRRCQVVPTFHVDTVVAAITRRIVPCGVLSWSALVVGLKWKFLGQRHGQRKQRGCRWQSVDVADDGTVALGHGLVPERRHCGLFHSLGQIVHIVQVSAGSFAAHHLANHPFILNLGRVFRLEHISTFIRQLYVIDRGPEQQQSPLQVGGVLCLGLGVLVVIRCFGRNLLVGKAYQGIIGA
mmetsp:Transcript_28731/g.81009  ORF Transcript_28731/g.81009 Transcript_28731/m.81009 type:complete len:229 (-) Transcript_28731:1663-2349(-)